MTESVTIIGAGLTGLMCAAQLATRGYRVSIFEQKSLKDIYHHQTNDLISSSRSMSMDISARGIYALKNINVFEAVFSQSIPMNSRIIHDSLGRKTILPYGQYEGENILTVSRHHLFQTLFDWCSKTNSIDINFECKFADFDSKKKLSLIKDAQNIIREHKSSIIIGADGVNSGVREAINNRSNAKFHTSYFPMSYKELSIDIKNAANIEFHAMHVWPREGFMLVAQPNIDGSFTSALLMPESGNEISFHEINAPSKIRALFDAHLKDASVLIDNLEAQYLARRTGKLKIIRGTSWCCDNFAALIGDAAHGMVPFFGQGVNCCFEDCTYLMNCLERTNGNWAQALHDFDKNRVVEANAINAMSYENYPELLADTNIDKTLLIKKIEALISMKFKGSYRTYHNLVCFERVPYTFAQKVKQIQISLLERLSQNISNIDELDNNIVHKEMEIYHQSLALLETNKD